MRVLYAAVFLDSAAFNLLTAVTPAMLLALGGGNLQSASRSLAQMSALSAAVEFVLNPAFGGLRCSGTLTRAAPSENRAMRCRASRRDASCAAAATDLGGCPSSGSRRPPCCSSAASWSRGRVGRAAWSGAPHDRMAARGSLPARWDLSKVKFTGLTQNL